MDRTVDYLLKKYETRDINEEWSDASNSKFTKQMAIKEKLEILGRTINEIKTTSKGKFIFTPNQNRRAEYLVKNMDLSGRGITAEQSILMIIIYVKLETTPHRKIRDYYPYLFNYDITATTFINFLIRLNKFHISKIPVC